MRILLINDNDKPTGGAEKYFFELKARLRSQPNWEIFSIHFGDKNVEGEDFVTFKSTQSNLGKLIWRTFFHPLVFWKLQKHIQAFQPDVIHVHNVKQYTASVLSAVKPYAAVQTMHDFSAICPTAQNIHKDNEPCSTGITLKCLLKHQVKYGLLSYLTLLPSFYLLRKRLRKSINHFIAPSPLLQGYLQKHGFTECSYIPPFTDKPEEIDSKSSKPTHFLFAGHLGKHKGIDLLLEEFALACQENNNLTLDIVGKGSDEAHMKIYAKNLGIEKNVKFHGWQSCMTSFYLRANALIFPSTGLESFGMVVTEAMSHARPVIGINRGTTAWLVQDQETGLLFNGTKKGDLAKKMLLLAENPAFAEKLGKKGLERVSGLFNNEEAFAGIVEIYKKYQ